jgi:hypothetical protein
MRAAAAGNSTLGIPKSVGQEFSDADEGGKLPKKKKQKQKSSSGADYGRMVATATNYAK